MEINKCKSFSKNVCGTFINVLDVGVLLIGEAKMGKSEIALNLLDKGHKFIADDIVEIKKINDKIVGFGVNMIKNLMHIDGIGFLDIKKIYPKNTIEKEREIDIIIELETEEVDTIKKENLFLNIKGVDIPLIKLKVNFKRNLPLLIELIVKNYKLKKRNINVEEELRERVSNEIYLKHKKRETVENIQESDY